MAKCRLGMARPRPTSGRFPLAGAIGVWGGITKADLLALVTMWIVTFRPATGRLMMGPPEQTGGGQPNDG